MITGSYKEYMKLRAECIKDEGESKYSPEYGFILWLLDLVADGEVTARDAQSIAVNHRKRQTRGE